jgi:hypothetical protein
MYMCTLMDIVWRKAASEMLILNIKIYLRSNRQC